MPSVDPAEVLAKQPALGLLEVGVPLWIERLRGVGDDERITRARRCGQMIAEHGDSLQFRDKHTAATFDALAEGLACAAYQPGGVEFAGMRWEAGQDDAVGAGRAVRGRGGGGRAAGGGGGAAAARVGEARPGGGGRVAHGDGAGDDAGEGAAPDGVCDAAGDRGSGDARPRARPANRAAAYRETYSPWKPSTVALPDSPGDDGAAHVRPAEYDPPAHKRATDAAQPAGKRRGDTKPAGDDRNRNTNREDK